MKRINCYLLLLITIASCTQTYNELEPGMESLQEETLLRTRCIVEAEIDSVALRDSIYKEFFVSYLDARIYAAIHCRGESAKELDTIIPLKDDVDTLMYLVQYRNGWDVIAADKRGPLVVAMSDEGRFESNDTLPGFSTYLDAQMVYLKSMRNVSEDNKDSDAYIFWSMIYPRSTSVTREYRAGYWELYDSESETTTAESGHMIQTKWGQGEPWNTFVPYNKDKPTEKCAVGCTAVAGAQMLHYLHYNLECPQVMYTSGGCLGHNKSYSYSFSNATEEAWNNMALTRWDYYTAKKEQAALLMAYVGCAIDMNYGEESEAGLEVLNELFGDIGISSTYADYNATTAWNSLKNDMPVIIGAKRLYKKVLGVPFYKGHAWIMDGWKTVTTRYTNYYGWVDSLWQDFKPVDGVEPINPLLLPDNDMIKYRDFKTTTTTVVSKSVLMNWGWDGSYDNIYCTLDGAWSPYSDRVYQYDKEMIHGFTAK